MPLAKYQAEVVLCAADFKLQDEIALFGETLASIASITVAPSGLTLNSVVPAAISGTKVNFWVSGGSSGASYTIKVLVVTSAGKTLESLVPLTMLD